MMVCVFLDEMTTTGSEGRDDVQAGRVGPGATPPASLGSGTSRGPLGLLVALVGLLVAPLARLVWFNFVVVLLLYDSNNWLDFK